MTRWHAQCEKMIYARQCCRRRKLFMAYDSSSSFTALIRIRPIRSVRRELLDDAEHLHSGISHNFRVLGPISGACKIFKAHTHNFLIIEFHCSLACSVCAAIQKQIGKIYQKKLSVNTGRAFLRSAALSRSQDAPSLCDFRMLSFVPFERR